MLPEPGLFPEWKAMWQTRVFGSCPAGGSGYSSVASGHLALTWLGCGQQPTGLALFSFPSFFQNTNSAPGGPKSWAHLNRKPAGHEGGNCVASEWVVGGMGTFSGLFQFSPGSLQPEPLWTLLAE